MFATIRRMRVAALATLVALTGVTRLGAQQAASRTAPPATLVTFDEALKMALIQNVGVKQAQNAAALNSTAVAQQKLAFLPSLSLNANTGQSYGNTLRPMAR